MHMFAVALLMSTAVPGLTVNEPSEGAMRHAFAADLADGVNSVLAYVAETGGEEAVTRIRKAGTDRFEIRGFRKLECHADPERPGHVCAFAVAIDTVRGPIEQSITGRFEIDACGLVYRHDA